MEFDATCDRMGRSIDETRVGRGRFYRAAWWVGRRRVRVCAFGDYVRVVMMTCERVKVTTTDDAFGFEQERLFDVLLLTSAEIENTSGTIIAGGDDAGKVWTHGKV